MFDFLNEFEVNSPVIIILRLLCASLSGFVIGIEREKHNQPAGMRTHMALSLGAAIVMLLSIYIPADFIEDGSNADPGRLAAQVISGIGFLGAGAIVRYGFNVKGLTTSASIWVTSGIGLTFGAGYYLLGFISTFFLVAILYGFGLIEDLFFEQKNLRILSVVINSERLQPKKIFETVEALNIHTEQPSIREDIETGTTEVIMHCRVDEDFSIRKLFESIKSLDNVKTIRFD